MAPLAHPVAWALFFVVPSPPMAWVNPWNGFQAFSNDATRWASPRTNLSRSFFPDKYALDGIRTRDHVIKALSL